MKLADLTVEVRDITLTKQGIITPKYLDFQMKKRNRGVGEWRLTLPRFHPMTAILATPGSGLVISLYGVEYMSGPTTKPGRITDQKNPDGTFTFTGVSDDILLAQALAFPQPGNADPTTQNVSNDVRTGNAESLMRSYVAFNIANGALMPGTPSYAPAGRRTGLLRDKLKLENVNGNRGPTMTKSPRFQNLAELLGEIGVYSGLGFQIIQRGAVLQFEVLTLNDKSDLVRLDINTGTLVSEQMEQSPPTLTMAIVAGQGEGTSRQFVKRTTADSVAAEAEWGLRIEEFIDQRNTNVVAELQQAGDEALFDRGFTATAVKAIPADDQTMKLVIDWNVGDTVGLVVEEQATTAVTTEAVIIANSARVAVGAAIGDVVGFDASAATAGAVDDNQRRVSKLERTETGWGSLTGVPAALTTDPNADRLLFWDDSAGQLDFLSFGAPISITGTVLSILAASTTVVGASRFATNAEAQAQSLGTVGLTPAGFASITATTTRSGHLETADSAEAAAMAALDKIMTPGQMGQALANQTRPVCKLSKSSAQNTSGTANTQTAVLWNVEEGDPTGMHDNVSNTSRVTIARAGWYWVNAAVRYNSTTGMCNLQLAVNGTPVQKIIDTYEANANNAYPQGGGLVYLNAGDYIETLLRANAATVALIVANCYFDVIWMGA